MEYFLSCSYDFGVEDGRDHEAPYMANGRTEEHENYLGVPLLHFQLSDEADHARQEW